MGARRALFDQLDTDGSGGIDGDELAAGLAAQGYQVLPVTPMHVVRTFHALVLHLCSHRQHPGDEHCMQCCGRVCSSM